MTPIEFAALYVAGAAVTAFVCGVTDVDDSVIAPMVFLWPVAIAAAVVAVPLALVYRAGLALRAKVVRAKVERL